MRGHGIERNLIMPHNEKSYSLLPYIREDIYSLQEAQQAAGWQITRFNLPDKWKLSQGEGVKIAVIDTGVDLEHPDLKNNLLQGKNFVERNKDPNDKNSHGCVSPDCLIHTTFNGIERIESLYESIGVKTESVDKIEGQYEVKDISNMDVLTYSFDKNLQKTVIGKINSVQKLPVSGDVVKIKLAGNISYLLTPWHPVYLLKHKNHSKYEVIQKRADQIAVGDGFIFNRGDYSGRLGSDQYIDLEKYFVCGGCGHMPKYKSKNKEFPTKCKKCHKNLWIKKNKKLKIDLDLAYLCGIVLTDGYVSKDRVEVSSETVEILLKVKKIADKNNWTCSVEKHKKRALIYGKECVSAIKELGIVQGKKSIIQSLPNWVGKAKIEEINSFVAGVIDGDGCIDKNNIKNRITSASYDFVVKFTALLNSLGISSGWSKPIEDKRDRVIKSSHFYYQIYFHGIEEEISKYLAHPKKIERSKGKSKFHRKSRRVIDVEIQKFEGYFYDFSINEYQNYIANGHIVSNTHVAGTICAENNDIGMIGVAPKSKVIPIKALDDRGNGNPRDIEESVIWAADQGADLITMSLGSPHQVESMKKAISYALSKKCVTFCAAGNAGKTHEIYYPANYPETIGIGAIDENLERAPFSCTGSDLDFLAPGVKIFSTVPSGWYAYMSGTSMSNPFAVGCAALLLSYVRNNKINIKLENDEDYRKILKKNTISLNNPEFSKNKFFEGFGIIDPSNFENWLKG